MLSVRAWAIEIPEGDFFGLFRAADVNVRFVVSHRDADRVEGVIHQLRDRPPPDPPMPFTLERGAGEAWVIRWVEGTTPYEATTPRPIETLHGPAFAWIVDSSQAPSHVTVLWLDPGLKTHPAGRWEDPAFSAKGTIYCRAVTHTAADGLAANTVRSLAKTPDNHLWVGTTDGLSHFDGSAWETFGPTTDPPLPDEVVTTLAVCPGGRLAVGTKSSGIFLKDRDGFTPAPLNDDLQGRRISQARFSLEGDLWAVIGGGDGFYRLDRSGRADVWSVETMNFGAPDELMDKFNIESAGVLDGDRLLLGISFFSRQFGNFLFDRRTGDVQAVSWGDSGAWSASGDEAFLRIGRRLFRMSAETLALEYVSPIAWDVDPVESRRGGPWIVGQHGVWKVEEGVLRECILPGSGEPQRYGAGVEDDDGYLWLTNDGFGVVRVRPLWPRRVEFDGDWLDGTIWAVRVGTRDRLFFSNPYKVGYLDGQTTVAYDLWAMFRAQVPDVVFPAGRPDVRHQAIALAKDDPDVLWCGLAVAADGAPWPPAPVPDAPLLARLDVEGGGVRFFDSDAFQGRVRYGYSIDTARDGSVWYGTDRGVFVLRPANAGRIEFWNAVNGVAPFVTHAVLVDSQDRVLLGGDGSGLYIVDTSGGVRNITGNDGLVSNDVLSLYEDSKGDIWVASRDGVSRIRGNQVQAFGDAAGFPRLVISGILEDDSGNLWFGAATGLHVLMRGELEDLDRGALSEVTLARFGRADGFHTDGVFQNYSPTGARTSSGGFYFCMDQGVTHFNPDDLLEDLERSRVSIGRCRVPDVITFERNDLDDINGREGLRLPADAQGTLVFEYAVPFTSESDGIRYEFRLDRDPHWKDAGSQRWQVVLGLPAGRHVFEVRAWDRHDVSLGSDTLEFRIAPWFHQHWLFRSVLGGVLFGLVVVVHRVRIRAQHRILGLERRHALEMQRGRIARDLHDDLGSRISRLSVLAEMCRRGYERDAPGWEHLDTIHREVPSIVGALRQVVWTVDPGNDSIDGLCLEIRRHAVDFLKPTAIRHRFDLPESGSTTPLSSERRHSVLMSFKEILTNVVRHSRATLVVVVLRIHDGEATLSVSDDGNGIPTTEKPNPEASHCGNGLKNIRTRMAGIGGSVEIESRDPGTVVRLRFPLPDGDLRSPQIS